MKPLPPVTSPVAMERFVSRPLERRPLGMNERPGTTDSPLLTDLFTAHANTSAIPPIAPTVELYRTAREHDIAVFFITGRAERLRAVTEANLKNVGYTDFAGATFNSPDYKQPSIVPFKSQARADIEAQGYTIIANVGDQDSDLDGGHGGCPHKLSLSRPRTRRRRTSRCGTGSAGSARPTSTPPSPATPSSRRR